MPKSSFGEGGESVRHWSEQMQTILDEMRRRKLCDFRASDAWQPVINLYELESAYAVCVLLAGVDADSVAVECLGSTRLCIAGQRASPRPPGSSGRCSVQVLEIDEGPFRREIDLPGPVDAERIEVRHDRGFAWITLRKIRSG